MTERINFSNDVIIQVAKKTNCNCAKCGVDKNIHVHHILPLSKGGDNSIENLILLCEFCHKLIHKKDVEGYDEEQFYSNNSYKYWKEDMVIDDKEYTIPFGSWDMSIDSTDHFEFLCPKCKCPAVISKIHLQEFNSLNMPPCFYFHLKCPACRLKGQRKGYLNYGLDKHKQINKK